MKNKLYTLLPLIFVFLLAISCAKEEPKDLIQNNLSTDNINSFVVEDEELEELLDDLFFEIEDSGYWLGGFKSGEDEISCKTISVDPPERGVFPKTITIDFGEGCELREGVIKKGQIIIEMSAQYNADSWEKTVRFKDYWVNDKLIEGGKNISFVKEGRNGKPTWKIKSRMKISKDDAHIQRNTERTRIQTEGFRTPGKKMDDHFLLAGSSQGINRQGNAFKRSIVKPLHTSRDCKWIKKGSVKIEIRGKSEAILDYGDGMCDNKATVTIDGETKEITLKRR